MSIKDRNKWIREHGDVTTKEEQLFYDSLPYSLKLQCIRQKKIVDKNVIYYLDFYFFYSKLCIEIDGYAVHHTTERIAKDKKRDAYLLSKGIKTLRFSNSQITNENTLKRIIKYLEDNYK